MAQRQAVTVCGKWGAALRGGLGVAWWVCACEGPSPGPEVDAALSGAGSGNGGSPMELGGRAGGALGTGGDATSGGAAGTGVAVGGTAGTGGVVIPSHGGQGGTGSGSGGAPLTGTGGRYQTELPAECLPRHATRASSWFEPLGVIPGIGTPSTQPIRISADGSTVVGMAYRLNEETAINSVLRPFRWTAEEGLVLLAYDSPMGYATGVNADGSVIVGIMGTASRWTQGRLERFGLSEDGSSLAADVSDDAQAVVGWANEDSDPLLPIPARGFRWTNSGFEWFPGSYSSVPAAVSGDGRVVAGYVDDGTTQPPYALHAGGPIELLPRLPGFDVYYPCDLNFDGSVIVGEARALELVDGNQPIRAAVWSNGEIRHLEPPFPGYSTANGVNADGSVIVGTAIFGAGTNSEAAVWDAEHGWRAVSTLLREAGISLSGWGMFEAKSVSANGKVIAGNGYCGGVNYLGWVARLPD